MCSSADPSVAPSCWQSLGASPSELTLDFTLPTGQSFRWRKSGDAEYTGVINDRLVRLRQGQDDTDWQVLARGQQSRACDDLQTLQDYFNLHEPVCAMSREWSKQDARYRLISPYFPGARIMRQDPTECLFQFICSSNNHISRIHGMVERLCAKYGSRLAPTLAGDKAEADGMAFHAFPTLQQLSKASEDALRADGFGYRAKFIKGSVDALQAKPGGGDSWLQGLRTVPYKEAVAELITLPGIGPKVAACICLFSLDKHEAIPVDTHVWQLATKYYTPSLKGKSLTPKIMTQVEDAFIEKFGPYAGWAHNVLFISDLASSRQYLPANLKSETSKFKIKTEEPVAAGSNVAEGSQEEAKVKLKVKIEAVKSSPVKRRSSGRKIRLSTRLQGSEGEGDDTSVMNDEPSLKPPSKRKRK